ncbi:MAG TPA: hypothetical protein VIU41_09415 [Geobacteraceae bacterium]
MLKNSRQLTGGEMFGRAMASNRLPTSSPATRILRLIGYFCVWRLGLQGVAPGG